MFMDKSDKYYPNNIEILFKYTIIYYIVIQLKGFRIMNIIVCVKQVPASSKVQVDPVTGVLIRDGADSKLNPFDLFALESAFSIAENVGGTVKTLSMGPPPAKAALDETLWMGADEAVLLSDRKFGGADVAATASALKLGIEKMGDYGLIICGKQTTDGDTAQVGPELAEKLGIDHIANVIEIVEATEEYITVVADMDRVLQTAKLKLPCLITIDKDANTPRLPSYRRKLEFQQKESVKVYSVNDLEGADENVLGLKGSPTKVERIFSPEKNLDRRMLTGSSEELSDNIYTLLKSKKFI